MNQHAKQLDKRRKFDKTEKKKSHGSECPVSVDTQVPVDVSQILMLLPQLPLAICLPSGLKETLETSL
jgi:hypothetical protein